MDSQHIPPSPYGRSMSRSGIRPPQMKRTTDSFDRAQRHLERGLSDLQNYASTKFGHCTEQRLPFQQTNSEECEKFEEADLAQDSVALLKEAMQQLGHSTKIKFNVAQTPASSIVEGYSRSVYQAIEYFMRVLVPNNAPVYSIFQVSNVNCLYFLQIIVGSQAQYLFHSAFALLHLVVGNVLPQTTSSRHALQHTGVAIALLRTVISKRPNQSDDATFLAVVCLASFARALGDYTGYNVHRTRIAQMMKSRGGLQNTGFQGYVQALTLQFAPPRCIPLSLSFDHPSRWAPRGAVDPTDPFFHDSRRILPEPPASFLLSCKLTASLAKLPLGFQRLVLQNALSNNTIELLFRIANAHQTQAPPQNHKQQEANADPVGWHTSRYNDFWECCPFISRAGPDLEKYLCLSLLLYTANEFAPNRACHKSLALYSGPRRLLASEIGLLDRVQLTPAQRECWMWIWWVVVDSWTEATKSTETASLLMTQFWASFPEVQQWTALQDILERFFRGKNFEAAIGRLRDVVSC